MTERRLGFTDRFTEYLVNTISEDTSGDSIDNEIVLSPDVRQPLVLELSGDEYTKVLASVMTGSDLLYNSIAQQITWLVWKAGKVNFCDTVANCIENSENVRNALEGFAGSEGGGLSGNEHSPIPISARQENLLPSDYNCDADHRYAMARAIVDSIHKATDEVFQAIEVLTNPVELAAEMADNSPILGALTTALDIVSWIQNTAYEAYTLAWSDVIRDEIACELFCEMVATGECELTLEMIQGVYEDIPNVTPPPLGEWLDWAAFVITIPLTAAMTTVKACSLMGIGALLFGSKFGSLSLGIRSFDTIVALAADETSDDWLVLCDPCQGNTILITFDDLVTADWHLEFTSHTPVISPTIPQSTSEGNPVPSCKAAFVDGGAYNGISQAVYVNLDIPNITVTKVTFQYYYTQPSSNVLSREVELFDVRGGTLLGGDSEASNNATKLQWNSWTYEPSSPISGVGAIKAFIGVFVPGATQGNCYGYLDNIRIDYQ